MVMVRGLLVLLMARNMEGRNVNELTVQLLTAGTPLDAKKAREKSCLKLKRAGGGVERGIACVF